MRVTSHRLFNEFRNALSAQPHCSVVDSLTEAPPLADYLDKLDPGLRLDWSGQSFQGLPALRDKVIDVLGIGTECSADDLLITAGTAEANYLAIMQRLQPGDEIIVDHPGWPQPEVLARAIGATIKRLPRHESRGWAIDLVELEQLLSPATRLIFICNPNNPTGALLGKDELQAVAALAERYGAWLLTDEVYRGLEWGDVPTPSAAALYSRGISTGSLSKVLGLQGLRIGWLICRDRQLIEDALVLREDSSEIMNVLGEAIADIALEPARYSQSLAAARERGRRHLQMLQEFIDSRPELDWHPPAAGLIGFARLQAGLTADELSARLLAAPYRCFVMPGSAYDCPQHIRLGAGGSTENLAAGLAQLGRCLDELH